LYKKKTTSVNSWTYTRKTLQYGAILNDPYITTPSLFVQANLRLRYWLTALLTLSSTFV